MKRGCVSILIPNYNYGKYLPECFESVLAQTYHNIEVVFVDNASTDNSWKVAMYYKSLFEKKGCGFYAIRNERNFGTSVNSKLCYDNCNGEFVYYLCSDDTIEPTFIAKAMQLFECNTNLGMVIVHRNELKDGCKQKTVPFYNKSCIISGEQQAAVFMMSGVCVLSQVVYRISSYEKIKPFLRNMRFVGDWYLNFLVCLVGDVAYIKDPLYNYRIHDNNETHSAIENMTAIFEEYAMINDFVQISQYFDMNLPVLRYENAIKKIGSMCVRYAIEMIADNKTEIAKKYLYLALFFDSELKFDEKYEFLTKYCEIQNDVHTFEAYLKMNERKISYDPPKGYLCIEESDDK